MSPPSFSLSITPLCWPKAPWIIIVFSVTLSLELPQQSQDRNCSWAQKGQSYLWWADHILRKSDPLGRTRLHCLSYHRHKICHWDHIRTRHERMISRIRPWAAMLHLHLLPSASVLPLFKLKSHTSAPKMKLESLNAFIWFSSKP